MTGSDLQVTLVLAASFLALFGLAEVLYHFLKIKVELTRKFVHFSTGFICLLFPVLLHSHWYVLALCSSFALILVVSKRFGLLKSINAIDRDSFGSLAYPVSVYLCYLVYVHYANYLFFYAPVLILAIADPAAALVGKRWPLGRYAVGKETKSMMGSTAFFIAATFTAIVCVRVNLTVSLFYTLLIGIVTGTVTTLSEALSRKGWDNITIPLATLLVICTARYMGWL